MLDKLPKTLQGEVYQFLTGPEVLRLERLCKKVSAGARQDFIWRYLTNNMEISNSRLYEDTWKTHFWRNFGATINMTPERFNYVMCPIRHFKEVVKFVDSYQNFIFAADTSGRVGIFLINQNDLENDDETMQVQSLEFPDGVEYLKLRIKHQELKLLLITGSGAVHTYGLEQTGPASFTFGLIASVQLSFQQTSSLYVCPLNEQENQFYISNYPLDGEDFLKDQTIILFDALSNSVLYHQVLDIGGDPTSFNLQQSLLSLQNQFQFHHQMFRRFPMPNQGLPITTVQQYKLERSKQRLAVYDRDRYLIISTFQNRLIWIDTKMSEQERFLKRSNWQWVESGAAEQEGKPMAVDIRIHKGILIAYHLHNFKLYDVETMNLVDNIGVSAGTNPVQVISINTFTDELYLVRRVNNNLEMMIYKLDLANKTFVKPGYHIEEQEQSQINDIDISKSLIASATTDGAIKIRRYKQGAVGEEMGKLINKPYYINAGSKTIKTYKAHPHKQGVSMVKVTQNKLICVLGNLIRVYSFDIVKK